jgi:formylglycine-generating enzyme required for sulfatase activity
MACRAGVNGAKVWSYASNRTTYTADVCNDVEHTDNATTPEVWATGSGANCYTPSAQGNIFDLSGNVSEWTSTQFVSAGGDDYYRVRGGNYTSYGPATTCGFSFVLDVPTFANADLGFRCCGPNPPNVP